MLTARWLGSGYLVIATDDGSQESRLTDVYGYDCATELARPTVSRAAAYIPSGRRTACNSMPVPPMPPTGRTETLWVTNLPHGRPTTPASPPMPHTHLHRR